MIHDVAAEDLRDRVAPPLQTHLPECRLSDVLAYQAEFDVEGVQTKQGRPQFLRGKQAREVAVQIVTADEPCAVIDIVFSGIRTVIGQDWRRR